MKLFKKILLLILFCIIFYFWLIYLAWYAIKEGYTNSESGSVVYKKYNTWIPASNWKVHKYISNNIENKDNIENSYYYINWTWNNPNRFPKNNWWLNFVVKWIYNRKTFISWIYKYSTILDIDPDLVISCVMWEQIRIANKWVRWKLKNIIINWTPTAFRSYDVSLWIWWIKVSTAYKIKRDAIKYWYWDNLKLYAITESWLILNDTLNSMYATYLVKNILVRREKAWFDISNNPGVICTLYNMWNPKNKKPNLNPKIWWSIIKIWWKNFVYWWLSEAVYRYIKIYWE